MPVTETLGRRQCIPIIYTRGTHYEVGYDVGRMFASVIQDYIRTNKVLNESYIPAYETPVGRRAYDDTLENLKEKLLQILGHTKDALSDVLNNFYFVSAHIITDKPQGKWGVKEERFTSLCYAGNLPGYTMNYNHHGFIFSINTLSAYKLIPGKTPRHFLTRSLLSAENFEQAQHILRDLGCGAADGCSINMTFLFQDGDRLFHNAEMGPADKTDESPLNILTASPGEHLLHTNKYLRLPVQQVKEIIIESSEARMVALKGHKAPTCKEDVIQMLGDQTGLKYRVFQDFGPEDYVKTVAVGIFDCKEKTLSLYSDNPTSNVGGVTASAQVENENSMLMELRAKS